MSDASPTPSWKKLPTISSSSYLSMIIIGCIALVALIQQQGKLTKKSTHISRQSSSMDWANEQKLANDEKKSDDKNNEDGDSDDEELLILDDD